MRFGHAAAAITPVLFAGVGARDASGYPIRLASFRLEPSECGRPVLGVVTPRARLSAATGSAALVGLLSGRLAPAYGRLRVLDHDLTTSTGRAAVRPQVGIAARAGRVWPTFTVRRLVERAARRSGQKRSDRRLMVAAILDRMALMPWADVQLHAAPDLVARRARLAAACVHEPNLLVIDGLLDHLPTLDRKLLAGIVADLKRDMSVVAIGRDADALLLCCDQLIALDDGIVMGPSVLPAPALHEIGEVPPFDHAH
jgi:ABC-2 type transport system ATP-binding protein